MTRVTLGYSTPLEYEKQKFTVYHNAFNTIDQADLVIKINRDKKELCEQLLQNFKMIRDKLFELL